MCSEPDISKFNIEISLVESILVCLLLSDEVTETKDESIVLNEDAIETNELSIVLSEDSTDTKELSIVFNENAIETSELSMVLNEDAIETKEESMVLREDTTETNEASIVVSDEATETNEASIVVNEELILRLSKVRVPFISTFLYMVIFPDELINKESPSEPALNKATLFESPEPACVTFKDGPVP